MELLPAFAIMLRRVGVSGMRAVVQRSITFGGRKTSVTLEDAFWEALKEIAYSRRMTISDLVREIDAQRRHNNLSSAIWLFVLEFYEPIPNPADREVFRGNRRWRPARASSAGAGCDAEGVAGTTLPFSGRASNRGH